MKKRRNTKTRSTRSATKPKGFKHGHPVSKSTTTAAAGRQARRSAAVTAAAAQAMTPPEGGTTNGGGLHPAEQYIADVMGGKIVTGKWVKLAVKRHLRDLETAEKRGLQFDRAAAERAIKFFGFLKHSKGEWAKTVFVLSPWQQFCTWCIFGWKKKNEKGEWVRRFRMAYVKVARKNGKSTWCAGVGLELFIADGEEGAEVYSAATKKDQARIVHGEAVAMVKASDALSGRIQIYKDNLHVIPTRSKFEPLGADEDTMDGLNVHGAIIDELHAHKTRGTLDVLDSATGARRQPLIFIITTAGAGKLGVDQDMQGYIEKILEGVIEDDSTFGIVYAIDEKDDWRQEKCWIKANPNLGISVKLDDLRSKCKKAIEMPSAQNEFLQKHMNRQTEQVTRWISMEMWNACRHPVPDAMLHGRPFHGGMDLSSKLDVAAWVKVFPPTEEDPLWRLKVTFFVPEATAELRERESRVPYATWGKQGHLELTPGNVIDYDYIKARIFADAKSFEMTDTGYDPWSATQIALQLSAENLTCVEVIQGFRSLSEPTKELEKLIASGKLAHDGNPVMDWMVSNVSIEKDAAGNMKPSKKHSPEKIDGVAATVTALARALVAGGAGGSVYGDGEDLLVL